MLRRATGLSAYSIDQLGMKLMEREIDMGADVCGGFNRVEQLERGSQVICCARQAFFPIKVGFVHSGPHRSIPVIKWFKGSPPPNM